MSQRAPIKRFLGLNTKAIDDGLPAPEMVTFQNVRTDHGGIRKRPGMGRVLVATNDRKCMTFTAASSMYGEVGTCDPRVWALGTKWTVKCLWQPSTTGNAQTFFYAGTTTPSMVLDTNSGSVRWRVWDSAGTLTTVTVTATVAATQSLWLTRDGATLTSRADNVAGGTGTMSATLAVRTPVGALRFARDNSTNYFGGKLDYLTVETIVEANHNDRLLRCPDPRAAHVKADYDWSGTAPVLYDRSSYGNHGTVTNTPVAAATLCHNPSVWRGISAYRDASNRKRIFGVAGASAYVIAVP